MKVTIQGLLFAILAMLSGITLIEVLQAATFEQRYGSNSYIFNHPLYFKKIDKHGRIIRQKKTRCVPVQNVQQKPVVVPQTKTIQQKTQFIKAPVKQRMTARQQPARRPYYSYYR